MMMDPGGSRYSANARTQAYVALAKDARFILELPCHRMQYYL